MSELSEAAESTVRIIKQIIIDLKKYYPSDGIILDASTDIKLLISVSEVKVLEVVGEYLVKYEDAIISLPNTRDFSFMVDNDFTDELDNIKKNKTKANENTVIYIINKIKMYVKNINEETKTMYIDYLLTLLNNYYTYIGTF